MNGWADFLFSLVKGLFSLRGIFFVALIQKCSRDRRMSFEYEKKRGEERRVELGSVIQS